eukprot:GGOE01049556.1.p1 GENE.GGOE01049556.1~~GGOE01049556.1.p1  ORF type:complete len:1106 (+),score=420.14 GGOE01049556.1:58-3318(+)
MAGPDASGLQQLLQQFLEANNESRVAAEKQIAKFLKRRECVAAFMNQMALSGFPGVRQLSAILLRKKISLHWPHLSSAEQQGLQEALLKRLLEEGEKLVRTAVAHLVSVVGKLTIPSGQWPALLPFLLQCTQSDQPAHREIAMVLLYALTDTVADQMRPYLGHLVDVFLRGLADAHLPVRLATLRAIVPVSRFVTEEAEFQVFVRLVQPVLEVLQQCIAMHRQTEEEQYLDVVLQVFEVLDDFCQMEVEGSSQMLPALLQFMVAVAKDGSNGPLVRERATSFLGAVAMDRPTAVVKNHLVEPLLLLALSILVDQYEEDLFHDNEFMDPEEESTTPLHFASQLLDSLSCSLPNSRVHPVCFGWCKAQLLEGQGTPQTAKAALLALSLICKGCRDPMRKEVGPILDMLQRTLVAPEAPVREAAAVAISQAVEYLQPEILEKYAVFLPPLFQALDDPSPKVREKAVFAMENVADNLSDEIRPYLPQLMDRLLRLLGELDSKGQCICISSISAIVAGVEEAFLEFLPRVLPLLQQIISSDAQEHWPLRAKATECVGVIAASAGRQRFEPYFHTFFPLVMRGLAFDSSELAECSFVCLQNFAEMFQEDWATHLPTTMPPVAAAVMQDHGELRGGSNVFGNTNVDLADSEEEDSDDQDDDDEGGRGHVLRVRVADMEKKSAAIHALGVFAKVTRARFQPYLDASFEKLIELLDYFHEGVRENVIFALRHLGGVAYSLHPPTESWRKGFPKVDTLHPDARRAVDTLIELFLERATAEDSKEVVKMVCDSIAEIAKEMGPAAVHPHIAKITDLLLALIRGQGFCQTLEEEDGEAEEDEEGDHDQVLMDAVFETVDELAKVYGEGFVDLWPGFLEAVLAYLSPKRNSSDHAMALGTLAEVANAMGSVVQPFFHQTFPVMLQMLRSDDGGVRSSAAYGVGVMCQHCPLQATPHFAAALQGLQPLLDVVANPAMCVDNACAALARMLGANLEACHFDHVFPALLDHLPLRQDWQENATVYGTICSLLIRFPLLLRPHLSRVLLLLARVLGDSHVQEEVKASIAAALKAALLTDEAARQTAASLPADCQATLQAVLAP